MRKINFRSRRGEDGPLGFLIALPVWWATMGVVLVLGFWLWSLAANALGMARGGQAIAVGKNGEAPRRALLANALGGYAAHYTNASYIQQGRAIIGSVNADVAVSAFPSPDRITVKARFVARHEQFYPRPPNGVWE
ncbi:MAG: hypothetical protein HC853_08045 [Anaerolineae bacterium]|nr:hypothetical protein [Anaerolineae bacterium]